MIRAGQINGVANLTKDHDLGAFGYSLWKDLPGGGGVVEGLAVTTGSVAVGRALVVGIRTSTTPNEKFLMHIELTAAESIDTSGTKKVWLEPIDARIQDPSLNTVADGSGIAQLNSGADWPATAHIRLATVASGVITDARVYTRTAAEAARDKNFNSGLATGTGSAYVLELTPAPTAYATRMEVIFTAPAQNLSPVTINVNGLGAKTLKLPDGTTDVPAGMILSGQIVVLHYDGTAFRVTSAPYTGYNKASGAEIAAGADDAKYVSSLGLRSLKASDVQAAAGSDEDKYINAKQLHDATKNAVASGSSSYADSTAYLASSAGLVTAFCGDNAGSWDISGYTDSSNPPTTRVAHNAWGLSGYANQGTGFICFPVKKNDYWKVTGSSTRFFFPLQ